MEYHKYVYLIVAVLFILLLGRESKYTASEQATEDITLSYADQTLTEEASIAGYNQELESYINVQDGYQIVEYEEKVGEDYSYAIYRMERTGCAEKEISMYWEIVVLQQDSVLTLLKIEDKELGSSFPVSSELVSEIDVNFDGKNDILLYLGHFGSQGTDAYKCFLNNNETFTYCNSFTDIPNPSVDSVDQVVRGSWRNSAGSHGWGIYRFLGKKFMMTECLTELVEADEASTWSWKDEIFVGDTWIVRDFFTEKNSDVELVMQKYLGMDSHWGVDQEWWQTLSASQTESPVSNGNSQIVVENHPEELLDTQIQVISEHAGIWAIINQSSWYVVTDLDQNGRLEVISSFMQGSGRYSSNSFYEVNEALDGLEEVKWQERKSDSEADIVVDSIPVYYDSVDKVYYYIFDDTVRDGGEYYYNNKRSLSLVDGALTECILAKQDIIYRDSYISIACEDMKEKEISETEYKSIADTIYPNCIRKQASLFWFSFNESNMESDSGERSTLTEMLLGSFEGFQIQ